MAPWIGRASRGYKIFMAHTLWVHTLLQLYLGCIVPLFQPALNLKNIIFNMMFASHKDLVEIKCEILIHS